MQVDAQLLPFPGLRHRQAAILVRGLCVPTVPHGPFGCLQLPPLLQVVQVGFGTCVSWRKRQTEPLICGIWRRKQPNPPTQGRAPSLASTIHSQRKANSQTLPWLLLWTLPGQTIRAQKRTKEELREGKMLVLCKQKIPGCHCQPLQGRGDVFPKRWHFPGCR